MGLGSSAALKCTGLYSQHTVEVSASDEVMKLDLAACRKANGLEGAGH